MNRFHNKYHRHNHHSLPTAGEPDSAHDPIASKDDPFKGEFHVDGQLSAVSGSFDKLSVLNELTVSGKANFKGEVNIDLPITTIYEHLMIVPELTTPDYYFKVDCNFTSFPVAEMYLMGTPVFMITTAGDVGMGTSTPQAKLDVIGDIKCFNLSAVNIFGTGNLTVTGGSLFSSLTATNNSQIGYLEIGYVPGNETYLKTISGNRDLWFYTGNNLNLKMHPNGNNYFPGKVGIGMEPIEPLTLSGQMGFRTNGLVLVDNSYYDTLRIITNRDGDDDQHLFTFTYDGRYVVGDIFHDYTYPIGASGTCGWGAVNSGKVNIVETRGEGRALHITTFNNQPIISLYRANDTPTSPTAVKSDQLIGGVYAFGFNKDTCYGDRNVAIQFAAANDFVGTTQGGYTFFETTCASDVNNNILERVRFDHNGNVGINTNNYLSLTPSIFPYRNTIRPEWKFTVRDYDAETRPAAVIFAGVSADPMVHIIGGEGKLEQTALMLSDRNIGDANTNHIEFTHGSADAKIARISSLNRGAEGVNGGSLLFSTTFSSTLIPFERARINYDGDMGVGITLPNSRLHVHDDDKKFPQAAGSLRDVVTVSTLNNTNGILLSSVDLLSRVYNNNSKKELHITTSTTDGKIKFSSDNEKFAAVISPKQKVGINIDEIIDTDVNHLNTWSLSADNVKLVVNGDTIMCNVTSTSAGGRLYFNRELSAVNTDPIYIFRHDNSLDVSELRINIGDDTCSVPAGGTATLDAKYTNEDVFSIGNYPWTGTGPSLDWNRWVDVGACSTVLYNNLSVQGDATFDKDVTIKGYLSVVPPPGVPTVFRGDLYVDGNIFATGDITGYCGCAPPSWVDSSGKTIPAGWSWDPACTGPHPPPAGLPIACPSDIRLKLDLAPITDSLDKVMLISGNTFKWDETKQTTRKGNDVGVIAQEIEKVLPEIVHEDVRGYKNVQYEKIIPLLIESIKELKKEIDLLKSK